MRYIAIVVLFLCFFSSVAQTVEERAAIFGYVLQPTGPTPRIGHMPPSGKLKGSIAITLYKGSWFLQYGQEVVQTNLGIYKDLFALYVLRASGKAHSYNTATLAIHSDSGALIAKQDVNISRADSSYDLLSGKTSCVSEPMPVGNFITFRPIGNSKYEVVMMITGQYWDLSTDLYGLDLYASAVACIIYDIVVQGDIAKFPTIRVRTENDMAEAIHEQTFDTALFDTVIRTTIRGIQSRRKM